MSYKVLDYYFPFVVLVYGFAMTVLLNSHWALRLAETRLPARIYTQFTSHRVLGLICLLVGMVWSLQNLWLAEPPV